MNGILGIRSAVAFGLASALGILACSTGDAPSPTMTSNLTAAVAVTFHKDVEPILQKNCQNCHVKGGIAPFALTSYQNAKDNAADMADKTGSRTMPPWGAQETTECQPRYGWKQDARLSDADIATLQAWSDQGAPEGPGTDAPPPEAKTEGLAGVQLTLKPSTPYDLGAKTDQFRCFVLDPKITSTKFINGAFLIAGNPQIVHHALVFADPSGASRKLADATGSYDCFGGPGFENTSLVEAWAPGGVPSEYPANVGEAIDPGTLLVMQVHYHPHTAASPAPDTTTLQLRFTDAPPAYYAVPYLIGNFAGALPDGEGLIPDPPTDPGPTPGFLIPANVSGHTESMTIAIPDGTPQLHLYGLGAHMHYVGVDEKISLEHVTPQAGVPHEECLLQEPHWDFSWQRGYAYDAAIEDLPIINAGDKLSFRCTYDNTLKNPKLAAALVEQGDHAPHDVALGETTLDEMCLGGFVFLVKAP